MFWTPGSGTVFSKTMKFLLLTLTIFFILFQMLPGNQNQKRRRKRELRWGIAYGRVNIFLPIQTGFSGVPEICLILSECTPPRTNLRPRTGKVFWLGPLEPWSRAEYLPRGSSRTQVWPQHPNYLWHFAPVNVSRTQQSSCLTSAVFSISAKSRVHKPFLDPKFCCPFLWRPCSSLGWGRKGGICRAVMWKNAESFLLLSNYKSLWFC